MNRMLPLIVMMCSLLVWGCGKKEAPKPAALPLPEVKPVAVGQVDAPPATGDGGKVVASADGEKKAEPAKQPSDAVEPTDEGFAKATADVEGMKQAGDFSGAIEKLAALQETFPKRADEVAGMLATMKEERRDAVDLEFAVKQLTKDDSAAVDIAVQKLTEGGDLARIVLRKAVRDKEDALAAEALAVLADLGDEKAAAVIVQRFLKNPDSKIRVQLVEALKKSLGAGSAEAVVPLYSLVKNDPQFKNRDIAGVLGVVLDKSCEGKSEKFDQVLGQPGAYDQLKQYVQAAISSTNDPTLARWGSNQAMYFKVLVPGIRAQYYEGANFEKLLAEKKDEYIWIDDRKFQFPGGRQDNLSIRWEGKVLIVTTGKYTFKIASDDGNRLLIDGKKLFEQWGAAATLQAAVDLEAGLHDICVEYQQIGGAGWIRMTWSGPGFEDKPLTKDNLRVVPWTAPKPPAEKK